MSNKFVAYTLSALTTTILVLNSPLLANPASAMPRQGGEGGGTGDHRPRRPAPPAPPQQPQNYSAAVKLLLNNSRSMQWVVESVWNTGGKGTAEQKIRETLNGQKSIGNTVGIDIYGANVNLGGIQWQRVTPGPGANQVSVSIFVPGNDAEFKTTTPCKNIFLLGCVGADSNFDPAFRLIFDTRVDLKLSATGQIKIDDVSVTISNARYHGSNAIGTLVETFGDLFTGGSFSRKIVSRINGDYSAKGALANYIESAISRAVPANVLKP